MSYELNKFTNVASCFVPFNLKIKSDNGDKTETKVNFGKTENFSVMIVKYMRIWENLPGAAIIRVSW